MKGKVVIDRVLDNDNDEFQFQPELINEALGNLSVAQCEQLWLETARIAASIHQRNISMLKAAHEKQRQLPIERVPGFGLRDFLGHFSRRNFRERVIEATHAELVEQYQETLASGDEKRAAIQKRMIVGWLLVATFKGAVASLISKLSFKVASTPE